MSIAVLLDVLAYNRTKTLGLLDTIAKQDNAQKILGWRPGPGRAHMAWQLMHIAATDDRHVHVRMTGGQPQQPALVQRFAGGSVPDDNIPSLDDVRKYLTDQRQELLSHLGKLTDADLNRKPNDQASWTYGEWIKLLAFHEAHHQGQAHITLNLYKAAHG
jgi:uncharacterized damage-inducible protein DinB